MANSAMNEPTERASADQPDEAHHVPDDRALIRAGLIQGTVKAVAYWVITGLLEMFPM
jgi:hypothetical protein